MSLCDRCFDPGACCRAMYLNAPDSFPIGETMLEAMVHLATTFPLVERGSDRCEVPLPMIPLFRRSDGHWCLWCPKLTLDGRCGDYANRPQVCRDFEPASTPLCIHHGGAECGE